jgi:peroxiredoxin
VAAVTQQELHPWLNRLVPDFTLSMVDGGRLSLSDWRGFVVVVHFWSAECAWSRRADVLLVYRQLTWQSKGVRIVALAPNGNETENEIRFEMQNRHIDYPVVIDFDHRMADLYKAETTPHFFVLDRQGLARYVGALDDSTAEARDAHKYYVDNAVTALLNNRLPEPAFTPAYGCDIARKTGKTGNFQRLA